MKIGILTYHKAHNYGAILQAIATRIALQNMGHEAYYVDYWPDYHKEMYKVFSWKKFNRFSLGGKIKYLMRVISRYKKISLRIDTFQDAISRYIEPYCKPIEFPFDMVVIGSDQLWRKQGALSDYDPVYFGDNKINTPKQVTYAVSMGILPKNDTDKLRIKRLISNIKEISVREQNLAQLVRDMGYSCEIDIDSTFLLTQRMWENIFPSAVMKDKYVLYYNFQTGAFCDNEVYRFAAKRGLMVKMITGGVHQEEKNGSLPTASVNDFISLIRNAEYIFTSSFHGLAFAIIFNKQFYASYLHNSNRAETLLGMLGIKERLLDNLVEIPEISPIDYSEINTIVGDLRQKSLLFLDNVSK